MNKIASGKKFGANAAPLISVAMPVYNGDRFLAKAISSILAQTFADFELIIIDDGSTDSSFQVSREYQERDARIRLISRESRGLSTTLNEIIDLARGKWIARMDSDDISLPHRFERQLEWLEQTGADICGSWVKFFGLAHKRILKHPQTDDAIKMALLFGCPFAHPTVMMKSELARQLRYDDAWETCQDYDLWERAARAKWQMTNVPEVLLLYRQHEAQISAAKSAKQQDLTQKIRRRYGQFLSESMRLNKDLIDEVLKLREPSPQVANMDDVDSAFIELLKHNRGEARATVLDHATRLYFRGAANCPSIAVRWHKLNQGFGRGLGLDTIIMLKLLSVSRCGPESRIFQNLRRYCRIA